MVVPPGGGLVSPAPGGPAQPEGKLGWGKEPAAQPAARRASCHGDATQRRRKAAALTGQHGYATRPTTGGQARWI